MNAIFSKLIAAATGVSERQVAATVGLLEEGCTIPFIARYRKEVTGTLDEVKVAAVSDSLDKLKEIEARKQTILKTIEEQGKLTAELKKRIEELEAELAKLIKAAKLAKTLRPTSRRRQESLSMPRRA